MSNIMTPAIDTPTTVTLSKPLQVIDQTVSKLTLTPPQGKHLMKAGATMRIITSSSGDMEGIEVNPAQMGKLIGACFNIPLRSVEDMPAGDFMACSNALLPFFGPSDVVDTYLDVARFWNDLDFVLDLTVDEMLDLHARTEAVAKRESDARKHQ